MLWPYALVLFLGKSFIGKVFEEVSERAMQKFLPTLLPIPEQVEIQQAQNALKPKIIFGIGPDQKMHSKFLRFYFKTTRFYFKTTSIKDLLVSECSAGFVVFNTADGKVDKLVCKTCFISEKILKAGDAGEQSYAFPIPSIDSPSQRLIAFSFIKVKQESTVDPIEEGAVELWDVDRWKDLIMRPDDWVHIGHALISKGFPYSTWWRFLYKELWGTQDQVNSPTISIRSPPEAESQMFQIRSPH